MASADIITLHNPHTAQTRGMIGLPEFRAMTRKPLLVNTARGGLVDEAALVQALADQLMDNIEHFVAGTPTHLVQGGY
jgi:glycerate dehydrogenase